jgi:GT2 family glycosyltransferase
MPGLVARHRAFHERRPEREAALLGYVDIATLPPPTPFMQWMADQHLGYRDIDDPENAGGSHFFSGNVSAQAELLRSVGGFDDSYTSAGHEDIDLGMRLEAAGMRLAYDRDAVVEHSHPTDLERTFARMRNAGVSLARFAQDHPEREVPGRPKLRHRVKAAALTAPALAGIRTPWLQRQTWRFVVHTALRESYWDAVDGREPRDGLRAGRTLARLALRDEDARMPPVVELPGRVGQRGDERSVAAP